MGEKSTCERPFLQTGCFRKRDWERVCESDVSSNSTDRVKLTSFHPGVASRRVPRERKAAGLDSVLARSEAHLVLDRSLSA